MNPRHEILAKALKLREMAIRGEEGEKNNGKHFFEKYTKKHNITHAELESAQSNDKVTSIFKMSFSDAALIEAAIIDLLGPLFGQLAIALLKFKFPHYFTDEQRT